MKVSQFDFKLPEELIAQQPLADRSASRLLCLDRLRGKIVHKNFADLPELLATKDLLVMNDTKVIPARVYGHKKSGGKIEVLVERILPGNKVLAHIRASKSPKQGAMLVLGEKVTVEILERKRELYELQFPLERQVLAILEEIGHVPLPPYIKRADEVLDKNSYQTVYARCEGAVAAPTAGLHFNEELLAQLTNKGIDRAYITLHVGAGTFQPIRVKDVLKHKMHSEWLEVTEKTCEQVSFCKKRGGKVVAVGTTTVRSLETAGQGGCLEPYRGETEIFIYPGSNFRAVDGLVTNFHLPKSTLLMLVCAFAGYENVMQAYKEAVKEKYRFFSYGDAMLIM